MATARHHARLDAPAGEVWELVRDPGGIADWLPGVEACSVEGNVRTVTAMGADITEVCTVEDDIRRFSYTITAGPLELDHHLATIDILEDGDGCVAMYACAIEPGDMLALFDGIAKAGVDALSSRFGTT